MTTWRDQAKCRDKETDWFFIEDHRTVVNEARVFCATCPVHSQCLDHAIRNDEVGIWAGTTTNQRKKILRNKRKEAKKVALDLIAS